MRDWNSVTSDRYLDEYTLDVPVGLGILDVSRDINSEFVRKRTFDMTFWMINQVIKMGYGNYRGFNDKVESILENSLNNGDELCIILCQGLMSPRLSRIVSNSIRYFKKNTDKFVIGHIMARKERYPGLHRQLLIVNLNVWKELGKPPFLEQGVFWDRQREYCNYEISENKITAEYTPEWIGPKEGTSKFDNTEDGANWIHLALSHGITVENLNLEMRECKCFLYPYEDTDQIEKVWNNLQQEDEVDKLKNYSTRSWMRKLAYQEYIEKDRVYAFNTERLSEEGVRSLGPVDHFYGAAAGFKPLALLNNNQFHENTIVHYFDWCESSLKFKKHVLDTWDGYNFDQWLLEHDEEYNLANSYRGNYNDIWQLEIEKEFGTAENFKNLWDKYRTLEHHYHIIDIVNEPSQLFSLINAVDGNKVLWITNIWSSMQLHWSIEPEALEEKWLAFEKLVPDNLAIYGQDYLARDAHRRVKEKLTYTHPRYSSTNKYVQQWG